MVSMVILPLLAVTSGFADAGTCDVEAFTPDAVVLDTVNRIVSAKLNSSEEAEGLLPRLEAETQLKGEDLLIHVGYQGVKGPYTDDIQWCFVSLINRLCSQIDGERQILGAISMLMRKDDVASQEAAWNLFRLYERSAGEIVKFPKYERYLQTCFHSDTPAVASLTDYLFQRNTVETFEFVLKLTDTDKVRREKLTRANDIAKKFYPKDYQTVRAPGEPAPEEITDFLDAMQGDEWWLPLYFAEVVRKIYAFQTEEVLARLGAIDNPVVKETLRAIEAQDPEKRVPLARWMALEKHAE